MALWVTLFLFSCTALYSLTLSEAEVIALENNPQIKAIEELVLKAREGRLEAVSKWLPQLSIISQAFKTQKPLT